VAHVSPPAAIIGCGNPNRGDDGAGPAVVRALAARGVGRGLGVRLLDAGTDGMGVMFAARGCRRLAIVDACRSGAQPGAVFEVPGEELAQPHARALTLHDFRWDHALHAGRRMFAEDFPRDVKVFLIEAQSLELGVGLTPCVAQAADRVAQRLETWLKSKI
jgi:hydrogenase maturation protease